MTGWKIHQPNEDVFPIKNEHVLKNHVSFQGGKKSSLKMDHLKRKGISPSFPIIFGGGIFVFKDKNTLGPAETSQFHSPNLWG